MSYFMIQITNLILKQILIFKSTIIVPIYQTEQIEECKVSYPEIYSIILENKDFYNSSIENLVNIGFIQTILKDITWSFNSYSAFADIICDKITHGLDYIILSSLNISQRNQLQSLAGIHESIRFAFMLDDIENIIHPIPGKVFSQYCYEAPLSIGQDFYINDYSLFNTIFNKKTDEIALLCKNALRRIVDCYYMSDYTIQITYMFDILDMLDPNDTEGKYLKTHVLPFVATSKSDYHRKCAEFKSMREKYRNPLIHYGKSIYDLTSDQTEIHNTFNYIKQIIVSYCVAVTNLNVTSFELLNSELETTKLQLGIK